MGRIGKKFAKAQEAVAVKPQYPLQDAVATVAKHAFAKFDETVEVAVRLGVDPKHADQMVRGTVILPHGLGGKATPAPPVGPALGQAGVNIMDFCKAFNAKTAKDDGLIIPVVITVYADRSYTFITKTPPVAVLIKRAVGIAKGSGEPNKNKVGRITAKQVEEIAKLKLPDLNCETLDAAMQTVRGTARSMGVEVA